MESGEGNPREYIALESLPAEKQKHIEKLELDADSIYSLRSQLVSLYKRYRRYLPFETNEGYDNQSRQTFSEIAQKRAAGVDLKGLINLEQVERDTEYDVEFQGSFSAQEQTENRELMHELHKEEVLAAFEEAVEIVGELATVKGTGWDELHPDQEIEEIRRYYRMRTKESGAAATLITDKEESMRFAERKLEVLRNRLARETNPILLKMIGNLEKELDSTSRAIHEIVGHNPEAYFFVMGRQLTEQKQIFDQAGRIVETPYVRAKIDRIIDVLDQQRPVFIHGELGSGKTEVAKHVGRTRLSARHLARWEESHPRPMDPEAVVAWQKQRETESEALLISGHKGIEIDQILAARAIERADVLVPEEQLDKIRQAWEAYKQRILGNTAVSDPERRDQLEKQFDQTEKPLFEQASLEFYRSPVVTKEVFGPLLQAMQQGRPVIIDEMNAIPHHVLIVMNDLLMRRPGEFVTPPFPDAQPFRVQEGFAVLATGNYKPEDGKMYVGRQPLDAAFLSRFGIVSYDYLPMQGEVEPESLSPEEQREWRRSNELYQMLVTRLLDKDLSATLPPDAFQKVYRLALVARQIQNVFSGRDVDEAFYAEVGSAKVKPQEVLKENVLSIRHLLPILDKWKTDGYQRDLDDYLFLDYVARSDARPAEKEYLYSVLKTQGDFFPDQKGWPTLAETSQVLHFPIEQKMYERDPITNSKRIKKEQAVLLKKFSLRDVIVLLRGQEPKRQAISKDYLVNTEDLVPPTVEDSTEIALERRRLLVRIQSSMQKLANNGLVVLEN